MSRTAVPLHVRVSRTLFGGPHLAFIIDFQTALHGFIESTVDEKDLEQVILPQMEKSLLRSPEISLSGKLLTFVRAFLL